MKTNLLIIAIVATLVTACTTGTQVTRTYDDDIYFSPKDVPPVSMAQKDAEDASKPDAVNQRIVISQKEKNADGTVTLNNDIYQRDENADIQVYDLDDQELKSSDTTVYYDDDSVKYVINNYYEDEDIDFTYRINRFHRPYFYDPFFYDDWYMGMGYYPFYSGYYGWGYDPWYSSSWGWGWGGYYGYSPYAYGYWGYGGYNPYYYGYYDGYFGGYYNGYYSGGGGFYNDHQVARRRSTEMNMPRTGSQASNNQQGGTRNSGLKDGAYGNDSNQRLPNGVDNTNNSRTWVQNGHTRSRTVGGSGTTADTKNATIVNNRRAVNASTNQVENGTRTRSQVARSSSADAGAERRAYQPSTSGRTYNSSTRQPSSNYTPSYSKPRVVNQPNYNNNSYSRSSRPTSSGNYDRGTLRSGSTGTSGYSAPRSSSSMRQTYQSQSYQSRSSSSGNSYRSSGGNSYRSSSGSDYSAPSRSYSSSPSYDSGGGSRYSGSSSSGSSSGSYSGGGSSGGSSSGGGGGSGHRR